MTGSHLIEFQGLLYSGSVTQNLLWKDSNVFLMDNHRAALWCWQQCFDLYVEDHCILHIDRHTDALGAWLEKHVSEMPDLRGLSIHDYLSAKIFLTTETELFRWDNYLSIHIEKFRDQLKGLISADHGDGDAPQFEGANRPRPDALSENLLHWLKTGGKSWIVNVDLDYFFTSITTKNEEEEWIPLFSNEYIDIVFSQIRKGIEDGHIKVVTVCLTPSHFTPGWEACLKLSQRIFGILGVKHPSL